MHPSTGGHTRYSEIKNTHNLDLKLANLIKQGYNQILIKQGYPKLLFDMHDHHAYAWCYL